MPKAQRGPEEIQLVREDIMKHALDLIVTEGYNGFSMRKLATRLGIAAKTIYNYFHNQDELYLCILTKGFEQLLERIITAVTPHKDLMDRLGAVIAAYVDFGLENANIYNLMFTWHVPKFKDYVGTPMEDVANSELAMALKCADFFMDLIRACIGDSPTPNENGIRLEMIQIWSHMHGYVAGINNTLLDYMHEDPLSLKNQIVTRIIKNAKVDLAARRRCGLKSVDKNIL
ncbi:MAG: TetR/AcrR family transcriptional regulator [Deltaproteobacteria bacterium]|nr:TetR/AcrR family transcriptional regulator [Deltaproteobacteria bacterium]